MPSLPLRRAIAFASATAAVCALSLTPAVAASAQIVADPISAPAEDARISLEPVGSFDTGVFAESAAEIVKAHGDRLFVVNAQAGRVSVLDYSDPTAITKLFEIASEGVANSVAVRDDGLGVIAFEATTKTDPGHLLFFDADAATAETAALGKVTVGALPDMVTFSPDGAYAVVANEGEPAEDFSLDPEGSVSVVSLGQAKAAPAQDAVRTAGFEPFEGAALPADVRVFGPDVAAPDQGTTPLAENRVSRNLEPEFVTVDGDTAYVSLQEANAVATIDLAEATVTGIRSLGFKDWGAEGNALDASDKDGVDIRSFEGLNGVYMPDGIESYQAGGATYLVTANEGDAREWGEFIDESRVKSLATDGQGPICAASPLAGQTPDADLGRLKVVTDLGFDTAQGCYTEVYAYGGRSFSIWTTDGEQVFDSGAEFERTIADALPEDFNSNHEETVADDRSDDKGPEPENLAIGQVGERTYAFIGLERVGGIMVYDITDPAEARFVQYVNNRDFSVSGETSLPQAGDLGPEGVSFIPADASPTGEPMLAVASEVSGTTTVFAVEDGITDIDVLTINDFHGRLEADAQNKVAGAAVLAGAVDQFEAANPNTLFVSAGDNIGASTFTSLIQDDEPTIDTLVAAGLDVSAVGNHEFDRGWEDLTSRVLVEYGQGDAAAGAAFGLGANVYAKNTTDPVLPEYAVKEVDGVRVAFIGTVTPDTANMVDPAGIATIEFGDQLAAANRVAGEITAAGEADVIILLTHSGAATSDCSFAASADGFGTLVRGASAEIDAIVSAHTHQTYACEVPVDGTERTRPVIQAAEYGKAMGRLALSYDTVEDRLISIGGETFPLFGAFPADAEIAAQVAAYTAEADVIGAEPVGEISADILRGGTPAGADRGVESSMGNWVADVYLWATSNDAYAGTPAQIAFMNPGGLRADLLYGTDGVVSFKEAALVQPFANTLVTLTLTGEQIEQILLEQWKATGDRPKLHLGVSEGFAYEYEQTSARSGSIVSMTYLGEEIAPTDEFTVVTNSFLANGGDGFPTFAAGGDRTDTGQVDLDATISYFEEFEVVDPAPLGRAALADEQPGGEQPGGEQPGAGGGTGGTPVRTPADGTKGSSLADSGSEVPWALAAGGVTLLIAGAAAFALRRGRRTSA